MAELLRNIAEKLKSYGARTMLIENPDGFLNRPDVAKELLKYGLTLHRGTQLEQRIQYELRDPEERLVLLNKDNSSFLQDIKQNAFPVKFRLDDYLGVWHIPSLLNEPLHIIDALYLQDELTEQNKKLTLQTISRIKAQSPEEAQTAFSADRFQAELQDALTESVLNWAVISRLIARNIALTIGTAQLETVLEGVREANHKFQQHLSGSYNHTKIANAVRKPKNVSRILEHLSFNYLNQKIALIVIDGMALWQYEMISRQLPEVRREEVIYAWIPSITQLSRQAIFRGGDPETTYRQSPVNEKNLWKTYWQKKGIPAHEISYQHNKTGLGNVDQLTKLALVITDLDEKMHASTDYADLKSLTENFVKRFPLIRNIEKLLEQGFRIFLTTDHGNIQAKGWRGLRDQEKLGTNKSGSRSQRHIEYEREGLADTFIESNPGIADSCVTTDDTLYLTDDLSFSPKEKLVTHGGSHLLEVLIPFTELGK